MDFYLKKIEDKKKNLPLLLLADPEETAIDKYLSQCEVLEFYWDDILIGQGAVMEISPKSCELKNMAIFEEYHRQGYGKKFLKLLCDYYKEKYSCIIVGTSDQGIPFYEKCGFKISHIIKNFFIDNYSEPIFENDRQCIDMTYLSISTK